MIYIVVIILLLCLSLRYDINGRTKYRDHWYFVIMVSFILIAGLRWRLGVDTPNSLFRFYNTIPTLPNLTLEHLSIGNKPFWYLLNSFILTIGGRFYLVQLIQSAFVNILLFRYIKKHSQFIFTCVLIYFLTVYYGMNMDAMKAANSIVICFYANDYWLEKKWGKAYLLWFIAVLFHVQALLLVVTPLLLFARFDLKGLIFILVAFMVGFTMQIFIGDYLELVEAFGDDAIIDKANGYAEADQFIDQEKSFLRIFTGVLVPIIYAIICVLYVKNKCSESSLNRFEPFLLIFLACSVIQLNVQIFYRFKNYYWIYVILYLSQTTVCMIKKPKNISFRLAYTKAMLFFAVFVLSFLLFFYPKYYSWFYPYSSVIEKKIDPNREQSYSRYDRPAPDKDQY